MATAEQAAPTVLDRLHEQIEQGKKRRDHAEEAHRIEDVRYWQGELNAFSLVRDWLLEEAAA